MSSWDTGYGDFEMVPDLETLRPVPWLPGTAMVMADLQWDDGREVVASPRQILRRQLARLAERGMSANAATELEFIVFRDTYEEAWKKGFRDLEPANLYNIDYSLLGTRAGRAADPPDPQRDGGGRDDGRELEGRVQPRPARDQLPLRRRRCAAPTTTRSTRTAPRRSPPRRSTRSPSWPSSTSARATRATSTARWPTRTAATPSPPTRRCSSSFVAGQLACMRELTLLYAPHVNSYKRFAARLLRADRDRLGQGQPHLLAAGRRPRRGAAGREPAAGRRRQSLPGAERADRRRPARDRERAGAGAGLRGQRLRIRQAARPPQHLRRPRRLRRERDGRRRPSARRSSTTT